MTERAGGAPDQDFEYTHREPLAVSTAVDHEPATEPIPLAAVEDIAGHVAAEHATTHGYLPTALDLVASSSRGQPLYRTKPAATAVVAAAIIALVTGGWLLARHPATAVEQSNTEASTTAAPTPTTAPPTPVSVAKPPPAPPPPPPPPPPAERTYSPPQRQYSPRYSEPTTAQKPRVDVTRAPMSVAPVPKPVPGSDSNTPGDAPDRDRGGRRRGCFGFC